LLCTKYNIKGLYSHYSTAVSTWSLEHFFVSHYASRFKPVKYNPHIITSFIFCLLLLLQVYLIWNYVLDGIVLQNNKNFLWSICISYDMYILARPLLSGRRDVFNKNRCFCIHLMCTLNFIYIYIFVCVWARARLLIFMLIYRCCPSWYTYSGQSYLSYLIIYV